MKIHIYCIQVLTVFLLFSIYYESYIIIMYNLWFMCITLNHYNTISTVTLVGTRYTVILLIVMFSVRLIDINHIWFVVDRNRPRLSAFDVIYTQLFPDTIPIPTHIIMHRICKLIPGRYFDVYNNNNFTPEETLLCAC